MSVRHVLILLAIGCVAVGSRTASAGSTEQAAQLSSQGKTLLANGDVEGALKAYAGAARADSENQEYRQQYAMVRQVVKMRKRIGKERNPEKWETTARALRAFYYEHRVFGEALPLDEQVHAKLNTAESAALLAGTQLLLGMNAEAAELLGGLDAKQAMPQVSALLGIALARQGEIDDAKAAAQKCVLPDNAGPGLCFDLARLRALLGEAGEALGLLTRCFESTPPSRLEGRKTQAKECPDFTTLVAGADFAKVLETKSKVKESACSGGTSCGKCPSRSKCSKSTGSTEDKKH